MKTILATTFIVAVMVFAFNAASSHAGDSDGKAVYKCTGWIHQGTVYGEGRDCERISELDDIRDLEQTAWVNAPEGQFTEGEIDELEDPEQQIVVDSTSGGYDSWFPWLNPN